MNKRTLNSEIPKKQLIFGLLIAVFVTFISYSTFYVFRECFRYVSITTDFDLWILSDEEVNFYNLIFGFIAVIFGQSAFFSFIFNQPKKLFERKYYRRTLIVKDQLFLNISFLYWISALFPIVILLFEATRQGSPHSLNFFPEYNFLSIFLVIVLFLQTWVTIRRLYKRKSVKWFFISALFLTLSAFGLSKINLTNYKAVNEFWLQKNIVYSYKIKLPVSTWTENWMEFRWSMGKRIYVATENQKPVFIIDDKRVEADSLSEIFADWKDSDCWYPIDACELYISQEQKMSVVNKLKTELSKNGIHRIAYAVIPAQIEHNETHRWANKISQFIPYASEKELIDDYNEAHYLFDNIIEVESYNEILILNKKSLSAEDFKLQIKKSIIENSDYIFKHIIRDNNSFAEYIKVQSLCREAVGELRDEYAFIEYGRELNSFRDLGLRKIVGEKYPVRMIEMTEELTDLIKRNI